MRYVALLRAVNVGGRKVEMAKLRAAVEAAGFDRVATYIASGNLFFDSSVRSKAKLTSQLEGVIEEAFGIEVPVILRTVTELEAVCAGDPFAGIELTDDKRFMVNFLADAPPKLDVPATSPKGGFELVHLTKGEAYVVMHLQAGRWPSEKWLEKVIPVPATGRFWHTTAKILEAATK
jgi:uncharacterized protein (DUF1697 family)